MVLYHIESWKTDCEKLCVFGTQINLIYAMSDEPLSFRANQRLVIVRIYLFFVRL